MSRSFRKSPVIAPYSNKLFKKKSHRAMRIIVTDALKKCLDFDALVLPVFREISQMEDSNKGSKCNLFADRDFELLKKLRRK